MLLAGLVPGQLLFPSCGHAHDSPSHSVEEITQHLQQQGESVLLLLRRASHLRVLGEHQRAISDWLRVLQLEPGQRGALVELAQTHLQLGRRAEALAWINKAFAGAGAASPDTAHLYALRAQIRNAGGELEPALSDLDIALAHDANNVDWYLQRAGVHRQLDHGSDRVAGLRAGYDRTRSEVLFTAWVEALIDTGRAADALKEIEPRLAATRLRSSWLLRRARALLALPRPQREKAEGDLTEAVAELTMRLRRGRPSGDLLLDRAQALLLLGRSDEAAADIDAAVQAGGDPWRILALRTARANSLATTSDALASHLNR